MNNSSSIGSGAQFNPQQFTDYHHQIYNQLRQTLMQFHQKGVPGMDKVLNALNATHVSLSKPQQQHVPIPSAMMPNRPETGQVVQQPMSRMGGY